MIFHNVAQNTDDWLQLRSGKITSSGLSKIMANYGKAFGEPAKKYATNIALEQILGRPLSSGGFSNDHTERGHEQEPIARSLYEGMFFCEIGNGGFFEAGDVGASPDGLVHGDGLIEIKSVISTIHYDNVRRQSFDPAYRWQLLGNLKVTGRDWIDFVSFCNDFPDDKKLYVYRLNKDDYAKEFEQIDERLSEFRELILASKSTILNSEYCVNF